MTNAKTVQEKNHSFKDRDVEVVILPCSQEELFPNGTIDNNHDRMYSATRYSAEDISGCDDNPEDVQKLEMLIQMLD